MSKEKLIERIKKLLALAGNNTNVHEASIAMERANKLLRENDMSMTSIIDVETEEVGESEGKTVQFWRKQIYNHVAEVYHCAYFTRNRNRHVVIGTESNRTTAMLIINYLIKAVNKEARSQHKWNQTTFKNGSAMGIGRTCQRIIAEENSSKEEVIVGTGLVPLDIKTVRVKANDAYQSRYNITDGRRSSAKGSQAGYDFGSSLSVNPQVGGGQRALS